jgi:outer membrane immunogenic protein
MNIPLICRLAVAVCILAVPARADDLSKIWSAPIDGSKYDWSGCYIGLHGGYSKGRNKNGFTTAVASGRTEVAFEAPDEYVADNAQLTGAVVGGQIGCNKTIMKHWLVGIESGLTWSKVKGAAYASEANSGPFGQHHIVIDPGEYTEFRVVNKWSGDVALRLGHSWDRLLVFGKIGWVGGRFDYIQTHDDFPTDHGCPRVAGRIDLTCSVTISKIRSGLLLGGGVEYAVSDNWSTKVEYNFTNFGKTEIPYPSKFAAVQRFSVEDNMRAVKIGMNYRFFLIK